MLFNCFSCGKLISLKKESCPHCMVELMEARATIQEELHGVKRKEKKVFSFFSLLMRAFH